MRTILTTSIVVAILAGLVQAGDETAKSPLGQETSALHLYVSNQSPNDDPVHVRVALDGNTLFDKMMPFDGAHHIETVSTKTTLGRHTLSVSSKTTKVSSTIEFNAKEANWFTVSYWYYTEKDPMPAVPRRFDIHRENGPVRGL